MKTNIILIFIALFITAFPFPIEPTDKTTDPKCKELKNEINALMEKCKYCEADTECYEDKKITLGCPFGCYYIRSHRYDGSEEIVLIERKIKEYHKICPECTYMCMAPPKQEQIGCRDNLCFDLEYYEALNRITKHP